jgi:hypothetical protein
MSKTYTYRFTYTETKQTSVEFEDGDDVTPEAIRDAALSKGDDTWESLKYNIESERFLNADETPFRDHRDE